MTDEEFKNEFFAIFPSIKEGKRSIPYEEWGKEVNIRLLN